MEKKEEENGQRSYDESSFPGLFAGCTPSNLLTLSACFRATPPETKDPPRRSLGFALATDGWSKARKLRPDTQHRKRDYQVTFHVRSAAGTQGRKLKEKRHGWNTPRRIEKLDE